MFLNGNDYITNSGKCYQYWHHVIFESYNSNPFFTKFYKDMTRNIPLEKTKSLLNFQEIF